MLRSAVGASAGALPSSAFDTSTPILVLRRRLGDFQPCPLGVTRSAGRVGIPVFSVRHGRKEPSTRSRYIQGELALKPGTPDDGWVQTLLGLRARFAGAVLLPIDDSAAIVLGDHHAELTEHYRLPAAPAGVHRRLASKRPAGCPVPASRRPGARFELSGRRTALVEQAERHGFPLVLKRCEPWLALHDASGVTIVRTRGELLRQHAGMKSDQASQVMLQSYIPGTPDSDGMFNGYVERTGRLGCAFTGRKLRHRGRVAGPAALGVCAANEPLARLPRLLLSDLGYRGIADMDFRYDRRDGRYKLLDVNPRIGSTFRLFVADNGIESYEPCTSI